MRLDIPPMPEPIRDLTSLRDRLKNLKINPTVDEARLFESIRKFVPGNFVPFKDLPKDKIESIVALRPEIKRFHGAKVNLAWFPGHFFNTPCSDKFGYLSPAATRNASKLPFNVVNQALLGQLGDLMADAGREASPDSNIPAGYTYFGQFVDHDITMDISSTLDAATDATTINNMRTPALDLESMYGSGPALHPFLYVFPGPGEPPTAIRMQLGTNKNFGAGGAGGAAGAAGMQIHTDFDLPRVNNPLNPAASSNTALIGDPRNDENLIVSQFHHAMLRFHNAVVDMLVAIPFSGDIFAEAKKIVTHHYQWAVVHDYLKRICGVAAVTSASGLSVSVGSAFSMPVEFSVAAYRFGHSMIRDQYWLNFNLKNKSLGDVFNFCRNPLLPVFSNWVVDFNAFFQTGFSVPIFNNARKIDSVLANGLESLPGFAGMMAVLAKRNLLRGLALGLPSGQGMAGFFGVTPMTTAQLTTGLPANEIAILNSNAGILLTNTPLWYYVLREASVVGGGNQLGPVGGKIVADTFLRMLKRDAGSYLNKAGGFTPFLPSKVAGDFTVADLVLFAGVAGH